MSDLVAFKPGRQNQSGWLGRQTEPEEYVDRILRGSVQAPTSYRLVLNLKGAKTLGLIVADSLLACADELTD
jgi:hypothetical protein